VALDVLATVPLASRLPTPSEWLPGRPDAVVNLQSEAGAGLVGAQWRTHEAKVVEIDFNSVGADLGPSGEPNRTYDIAPHAEAPDYDDSDWLKLTAPETERRLGTGRVCFNWYRLNVTVPEQVGDLDPTGATIVFEIVVDDHAEVWVDGKLPLALGQTGGAVSSGFNAPNRVILTRDARPGQTFVIAVFAYNGPISVSPRNYIWVRSATLDFYAPERARVGVDVPLEVERFDAALEAIVPQAVRLERVAGGFEFTEGPVWARAGYLLFSSPNTNVIYRLTPDGELSVFRTKSGYAGTDIGRYAQPGSNGLAFDADGRLTICQHGNRRVIRVEPRGNITVLADQFEGKRLNSPNDLVYRSDGALYFTDPPFGLPGMRADPTRECSSGVYRVRDGKITLLTDELEGPNGLAFSPDERFLYVGNWDLSRKVVMRYAVKPDGMLEPGEVFADLTFEAGEDAIDGVKVDQHGNVYVCGPAGLWVFSDSGRKLGLLRLPENPHNIAWGDEDRCALYVTALSSVYCLRLNIPGAGL
jgi:gluconolactonase